MQQRHKYNGGREGPIAGSGYLSYVTVDNTGQDVAGFQVQLNWFVIVAIL